MIVCHIHIKTHHLLHKVSLAHLERTQVRKYRNDDELGEAEGYLGNQNHQIDELSKLKEQKNWITLKYSIFLC